MIPKCNYFGFRVLQVYYFKWLFDEYARLILGRLLESAVGEIWEEYPILDFRPNIQKETDKIATIIRSVLQLQG